jgi:hypothetical protein
MQAAFLTAARVDPQHPALIRNVQAARRWFAEGGPARGLPLELVAEQGFQLLERTLQPALPGPLPEDLGVWSTAAPPAGEAPATAALAPLRLGIEARGEDGWYDLSEVRVR